ncbi:glutamate synthase-related protein [Shigella flexneri]
MVRTLQQAVQSGEYSDYQEYAKLVNQRPAGRCGFSGDSRVIPVIMADVEPASSLFKRFDTAAMSSARGARKRMKRWRKR